MSLPPTTSKSSRRGRIPFGTLFSLGLLGILGVGGFVLIRGWSPLAKRANNKFLTAPVIRSPLVLTVAEKGSLDSASNVTLVNQVEGSTTIISIVDEGTKVEKGQLLVELDSSKQRDLEIQQRIAVEQAEAALKQASETLEIQKTQNESDIAAAKLKLDLAALDLEKYQQGEYEQEKNLIAGEKLLAEEDLTRAKEKYEFSKRLTKKGYVTQSELEADRIAVTKAGVSVKTADEKMRVLENYTKKRQIAEMEANATEFKRELDRTGRKAIAALAQAEADLAKCRLTAEVERTKMEKLQQQIAACKIFAPQPGEVVYANTGDRRGNQEVVIEEGSQVRERQAIINLPDYTQMQVKARIHESRISAVKPDLQALIRVDASPGKVFHGVVSTVSSVPLSGSWPNRDLKEYSAIIKLTDPIDVVRELKPGLTAQVEILVERLGNALQVPVQAIAEISGEKYVFVLPENGTPQQRLIKTGRTNDVMVQVMAEGSTLQAGEQVVLNPQSLIPKDATPAADKPEDQYEGPADKSEKKVSPDETPVKKQKKRGGDESGSPEGSPTQAPPSNPELAAGGAAGSPPGGEGSGGRPDPQAMFARFDGNGDSKLTPDELPGRMAEAFATLDTNSDGGIDSGEWAVGAAQFRGRGRGGRGNGGGDGAQ